MGVRYKAIKILSIQLNVSRALRAGGVSTSSTGSSRIYKTAANGIVLPKRFRVSNVVAPREVSVRNNSFFKPPPITISELSQTQIQCYDESLARKIVLSHRRGGSGPWYITGWVSAFTCFHKDGKLIGGETDVSTEFPLIEDDKISHNVVSCLVKIFIGITRHKGTLFAGQVIFEAARGEEDAYPAVRPRNDWCMAVEVKPN